MSGHRDVRIVLVRPRDPRNVGAACRAMKCMGLRSLAIVVDGLIDPSQARVLAHYAADVLDEATVHTDLREAIGDAVLVAGTTRRRGRNRKYFTVFPEQLAQRIAAIRAGTIAVLFGNEEAGLNDEELALCNLAVTIPGIRAVPVPQSLPRGAGRQLRDPPGPGSGTRHALFAHRGVPPWTTSCPSSPGP